MKIVLLDPEAPGGHKPVPRGVVVNGKVVRSPAMRKLIDNLVRQQLRQAEQDRMEAEWVLRTLASAPPLTMSQTTMLRRMKRDLTKAARGEPLPA